MNLLFPCFVYEFIFKYQKKKEYFKRVILITIVLLTLFSLVNAEIQVPFSKANVKQGNNQINNLIRVFPDDSASAPLKTNAWLWHDSKNLFLQFEAQIDENFYRGKFAQKDHWVDADYILLQVITDVTNYYSYMFFAFPLGNKYDGIRKSDLNYDNDWNSTYDYQNYISDSLWKCKMKIPFDNFRFFGNPPYKWKIILSRWFLHNSELYSKPFVTLNMNKNYFREAEDIIIKKKIEKSKNYRIRPYFIQEYDFIKNTSELGLENFGLDFSFDPNISSQVKLSINPDYSDVPLDSEEDIYNLRYAPTFEENRYFFIEDLDVFGIDRGSSEPIFYSRHIMQPKYALKYTGDAEKYCYGLLSAQDKKVVTDGQVTNQDDFYNMAAFKYKSDRSSLQLTFLNRMNENYHNEVLHFEPIWEFLDNHSMWSTINLSLRDYADKEKKGYSALMGYQGYKNDFGWSGEIARISPNYSQDMGWINETDVHRINLNLWQDSEPNKTLIKDYGWYLWWYRESRNIKNGVLDNYAGANFWFSTQKKIELWSSYRIGEEGYQGDIYNWYRFSTGIEWEKSDLWDLEISYGRWKTLVYSLQDTYKSDGLDLHLKLNLSKFSSFKFQISNRIYHNFPDSTELDDEYLICNAKLELNLTNDLSLTNGIRYNNYEYGEQSKHLGFFSNFRWQFQPECNLYLGYKLSSDKLNNQFSSEYELGYMKINYMF